MVLLAKAVQDLPIGTAYAVWTGIEAVGTATLGIVLFDEPATSARLLFISVIVFGIVGPPRLWKFLTTTRPKIHTRCHTIRK